MKERETQREREKVCEKERHRERERERERETAHRGKRVIYIKMAKTFQWTLSNHVD